MVATVAPAVLFGPLGVLRHGDDIEIHQGQVIMASVDERVKLGTPAAAPSTSAD